MPSCTLSILRPPPPPTSTLFPYTTLFRSLDQPRPPNRVDPNQPRAPRTQRHAREQVKYPRREWQPFEQRPRQRRSEEHTSELQSRLHLVCRLLLEKKKIRHRAHRVQSASR